MADSPLQRQARVAGVLYLLVALIAPFSEMVIPGALVVRGDAAATAARIVASESLFRIGIAGKLVSASLFLLAVLALYRLLKPVDGTLARAMLALVVVAVPLTFLGAAAELGALTLFKGADFLAAFDRPQLEAAGYFGLRLRSHVSTVAMLLWGLWLFPFGVLVIRSGFIPRIFGALLLLNGLAYTAQAFVAILAPRFGPVVSSLSFVPMLAGELSIIAWLVFRGARAPRESAPA